METTTGTCAMRGCDAEGERARFTRECGHDAGPARFVCDVHPARATRETTCACGATNAVRIVRDS